MPVVLRNLTSRDFPALERLLLRDPVAHCFVASRVTPDFDLWRLGGELWGWFEDGELLSAMFSGANLVPVEMTEAARAAFVRKALQQGRRCSSIVGPSHDVLAMWDVLRHSWTPPREIRETQHLMRISGEPLIPADPRVITLEPTDLDRLLPASIAMFTEEVGVSPIASGGGSAYRGRVAELLRQGRCMAILDAAGTIAFKAEVGAVASGVSQIQGVWVAPHLRGTGLAPGGMAAVVKQTQERFSPIVSLYVNDYNLPAIRTYEKVGFSTSGRFATILF